MSEAERVQRWRQRQRDEGKEHMSLWLSKATKLRLEDLAATWRSSPSELVEQALAHFQPASAAGSGTVADTEQLRAFVADTVTETVTATLARDLPAMVREIVEGLAREALGLPVADMFGDVADTEDDITDTFGNVTDTEIPGLPVTDTNGNPTDTATGEEATTRLAPQRTRGAMRQRILTLLGAHPEGLSADELRVYLKAEKPLGDTLQGMRKQQKVRTQGTGRAVRYFIA